MSRGVRGVAASASRLVLSIGLVLATLSGCEDEERNAALYLLDRIEHTRATDDPLERHRRIEALARVPAPTPALESARDACHEMHEAAFQAEILSQEARVHLEALTEAGGPRAAISADQRATLDDLLRRSNEAADAADAARPRCLEAQATLRARYSLDPAR